VVQAERPGGARLLQGALRLRRAPRPRADDTDMASKSKRSPRCAVLRKDGAAVVHVEAAGAEVGRTVFKAPATQRAGRRRGAPHGKNHIRG